jgi:hypothetical protein
MPEGAGGTRASTSSIEFYEGYTTRPRKQSHEIPMLWLWRGVQTRYQKSQDSLVIPASLALTGMHRGSAESRPCRRITY